MASLFVPEISVLEKVVRSVVVYVAILEDTGTISVIARERGGEGGSASGAEPGGG